MSVTATIGPLKFISHLQNEDIAWFWNCHSDPQNQQALRPFDNIESMTIERQFQRFSQTKKDKKYRFINIGNGLNVDFKSMILFPFNDPENPLEIRSLARGTSMIRPRFTDRQRFSHPINHFPLVTVPDGQYDHNCIGEFWCKQNGSTRDKLILPSYNQILGGILKESMVILQHSVHPQTEEQLV